MTKIENRTRRTIMLTVILFLSTVGLILSSQTSGATVNSSLGDMYFTEQTDSVKSAAKVDSSDKNKVFTSVDIPAEFPGGLDGWRSYLESNLKYPRKAQKHQTQGVVKLKMVVNKDGSVANVRILSDPGDGLGEEALRVIQKGPNWIPASQNGKNVTYTFVQTVTFQLQ